MTNSGTTIRIKIRLENFKMANEMKRMTTKDYTAWDLNVPQFVHIYNRQKLEAVFKRKARRKLKQELKKGCYC